MSFTDCEHQYTDLNAEACCLCGEYKGDALDTYDRPAPVRSQAMAAGFAANYGAGPEVPLAQLSETGTLCSICKHHGMDIPQVESPSGVTCRFGHGGADAWIPPSEPQPPGPSVPVEELFGQTTVTPEFTTYAVDPLATYTQHELAGVPQAQPTVHHIEYGHSQLEVRMAAQMDARASLPVFAETPPTAFDYAYDYRSAHCNDCTLKPTTDNHCAGRAPRAPENFNGLMIVWGYPTHRAIRMGDASGGERSTLQQRLKAHGIEYDACYVTHAIACNVPYEMQKSDIPANVFDSCRYKLLTEVQNIQPRVILAFGSTAFTALMGDQVMKERREAYDCPTCSNERKWRLWGCIKCKTDFKHLPWTDAKVTPEGSPWDHFCACVKEDGSHTKGPKGKDVKPPKWQKHVIECSDCGGLKTKAVQLPTFSCAYNLTGKGGMAGGAFTIDRTPMGHLYPESVRQNTYLLGTYDPHQLHNKAATQAQKGVVGQFLLPSFDAHIGKVSRLLSGKKPHWDLNWSSTKDPYELRQFMNQALVTCGREEGKPGAENGLGGPQDHGVRRDHADLLVEFRLDDQGLPLDIDIETDSKEPISVTDIRCVGIHNRVTGQVLVLDTSGMGETAGLVQEFAWWVRRKELLWAAQNGPYDWRVIYRLWNIEVPETWVEDSMVAHTLLLSDAPHDLGHIAFQYTDAPPWKPAKNVNGFDSFESPEELHLYNAKDCRATGLALEAMKPELEAEGITHLLDFDMRKTRLALRMGNFGIPVNREVMLQRTAHETYVAELALRKMREEVGFVPDELVSDGAKKDAKAEKRDPRLFNPNSNPQLQWALYTKLGLAPINPQAPSADKEALQPHIGNEFVQTLFRYRGADKLRSTIGNIPIGQDGRFHPEWKPQGARTGRWSSSPNFQNWQGQTKTMVEAPAGRLFVGADYSQLELRIIAAAAGDEKMIDLCANAVEDRKLEPDYDPHSYITAISFGATFTSLSLKDPTCTAKKDYTKTCLCETCRRKIYRDITKRTIYALAYGGDEHTVLAGIYNDGYDGPAITLQMVKNTVDAYFTGFKKVKPWREGVLREAKRTGYVREMMGGRYRCFPLGDVDDTVAYNFGVQGAAATIMDTSIITLDEHLYRMFKGEDQIFATVHDAGYVECNAEHAEEVADLVERCLSTEVRFGDGPWMALPASASIATNWKEAA